MTDPLAGFEQAPLHRRGRDPDVYRTGSGPAVIVISEMPGITPEVADFARRVAGCGLTAVLPHLFGDDGRPMSVGYIARSFARALHRQGVHRPGHAADQPGHRLAAGPGRRRARPVRRSRGGGGRDVLHRGLRPRHDGGRRGGGPGAQPAVPALPHQRRQPAGPRPLRPGPGAWCRPGPPPAPACSGSASPATGPARPSASTTSARSSATPSSAWSSTPPPATPTATSGPPTRCSPTTSTTAPAPRPGTPSTRSSTFFTDRLLTDGPAG